MCCGQEGGDWFVLTHEVKYTGEDLQDIVKQAMAIAVERLLEEGGVAYHLMDDVESLWAVATPLLRERWGFKDLEFTARCSANAWRDLVDVEGMDYAREDPVANAIVEHLKKHGYSDAFFEAWRAGVNVAMDVPKGEDPMTGPSKEHAFGANAGTAFRLNEILGRRAITKVIEREW